MHARMLSVVVFSAERLQAAATAAGGSSKILLGPPLLGYAEASIGLPVPVLFRNILPHILMHVSENRLKIHI